MGEHCELGRVCRAPDERERGTAGGGSSFPTLSPSHTPRLSPSILTQHQVKSTRGKVVSAGKGTTLATGAAVTYSKYAGTEVTLADGKELVILKEEDVIGVLGGGPEEWGKLQPLGDRVLLQALEAAKETAGGVILASDEVERPTLGKVRKGDGERVFFPFPPPLVRSRRPPAHPQHRKKKKGVTMNHANKHTLRRARESGRDRTKQRGLNPPAHHLKSHERTLRIHHS